ncbi:DUF2867 domain-containing protein [Streptomyces sp. NPDC048172]|uniref:DUF2867 domain-containing protein n=1 Tax=Streptomyces sp. NPDC048172 TaxID=3365505 RepID=UPI0037201E53
MRLPRSAYTARSWRAHEVAGDFAVEDVWALPTPGGRDDFGVLVEQMAGGDTAYRDGLVARFLFAVRWKLGALLRLDRDGDGVGTRVMSLRDRLPADLREGPQGPGFATLPFTSVFQTEDEWLAEMANRTVHGALHLGWVPDGTGVHRAQMTVLVKPNGPLGAAYMLGIKPFRYVGVYPALLRSIGEEWEARESRESRGPGAGKRGVA